MRGLRGAQAHEPPCRTQHMRRRTYALKTGYLSTLAHLGGVLRIQQQQLADDSVGAEVVHLQAGVGGRPG